MRTVSRRTAIALLSMTVAACASRRASVSSLRAPPMWRAVRGARELFLFGQIPLPQGVTWFTQPVQSAFGASDEIWFENPQFEPQSANAAIQKRIARGGPRLGEVIGSMDRQRLGDMLQKAGRMPDAFDDLLTWQAYLAVTDLVDRLNGLDPVAIPERKLKQLATERGKSIRTEWSSIEEIMEFSSEQTVEQQLQLVSKTLDGWVAPEGARRRAEAWAAGDISSAVELDERFRAKYPLLTARLVTERNRRWVPRLADALERNASTFVCVGLGHLVGPDSIQALLLEAGLQVSRV